MNSSNSGLGHLKKNNDGKLKSYTRNKNGGDIIFVPYDLEVNKWTRFKDWMTVIGQVAAFIVLIQNIAGS